MPTASCTQDYSAKRPMEIETYLGAPVRMAKEAGLRAPRLETLYAMLHHVNVINQQQSGALQDAQPSAQGQAVRSGFMSPGRLGDSNGGNGMIAQQPNGLANGHLAGPGSRPNGKRGPFIQTGPPPPMRRAPPSGTSSMPPRQGPAHAATSFFRQWS
ncbi:hypothetical protein MRB53_038406 [Persea americana]|nr:hypothetical protein MRB53_038406 [Persea americana]